MAEADVSETPVPPIDTPIDAAAADVVSGTGETVPSATVRTRRRRERLRHQGIQSVVYELPSPVISGLARVADANRLTPSEYLTRLVASDLLRANILPFAKEAS